MDICDPSQLNRPPGSAVTFSEDHGKPPTSGTIPSSLADSDSLPLVLSAPKVIRLSADGVLACLL